MLSWRKTGVRKGIRFLVCILLTCVLVPTGAACGRTASSNAATASAADASGQASGSALPAGPGIAVDSYQAVADAAASRLEGGADAVSAFFGDASDEEKAIMALQLADDMANVEFFGRMNQDMMAIGAAATAGYPHPLLLNNYGAMVLVYEGAQAALPYAQLAVDQAADNPVLLTNLANLKLELGDDQAAEQLAKQALQADGAFGPAFQVLTTLHLKRDQPVLAAETLVKSAQRHFDDLTRWQFDTYLMACEALDPEKDEYPLKEAHLDLLYKIARENVDTLDNGKGTDTPVNQLQLKPFPQITSADNLINSREWLREQMMGIEAARDAAQARRDEYADADDSLYGYADLAAGTYPLVRNMRQIYAIQVMESFWDFKIRQRQATWNHDLEEILERCDQDSQDLSDRYFELRQKAEVEMDEAQGEMWSDLFGAMEGGALPDVKALQDAGLLIPRLDVKQAEEQLDLNKRYTGEIITLSSRYYADLSQMLEEYWLKTGGLLKYLAEEAQFEKQVAEREIFVYGRIPEPLYALEQQGDRLFDDKERLRYAQQQLAMLEQAFANANEAIASAQAEAEAEREAQENDEPDDEMVPDIEKEAFEKYPEAGDLGDIGVEADLFGLAGGAIQFNGDRFKLETESIAHKTDNGYSELLGGNLSSTLYGVTAVGNTEWITETNLAKTLPRAGALGKAGKVFGKIGFGYSSGTKVGRYVVRDANGQIVDRGIHYLRESGGNVGLIGKSSKVEVFKSQMKGYSLKSTGSKYKFWFASYEQ